MMPRPSLVPVVRRAKEAGAPTPDPLATFRDWERVEHRLGRDTCDCAECRRARVSRLEYVQMTVARRRDIEATVPSVVHPPPFSPAPHLTPDVATSTIAARREGDRTWRDFWRAIPAPADEVDERVRAGVGRFLALAVGLGMDSVWALTREVRARQYIKSREARSAASAPPVQLGFGVAVEAVLGRVDGGAPVGHATYRCGCWRCAGCVCEARKREAPRVTGAEIVAAAIAAAKQGTSEVAPAGSRAPAMLFPPSG